MSRRVRYRTRPCKFCGMQVTTNALGRAAHHRGQLCAEREFRRKFPAFTFRMNQIARFVIAAAYYSSADDVALDARTAARFRFDRMIDDLNLKGKVS